MIKIIKNIKVYTPKYIGVKDVAVIGEKIASIEDSIEITTKGLEVEIIDGQGKILTPGFIDGHVHILGGGGEGGYKTRTPEIMLSDIIRGGVTTVVGCLGTDGISRNMVSLLAKARGLEEEGVSTYIYTGSYRVPVTTITGEVMKDIIAIDKIIGVGEVAISDHRSSHPHVEDIKKLVSDARVAGILSGKAGVVNFHLGDSKSTIKVLDEIIENTELPYSQFYPTHMNRNPYLFEEAKNYAKKGGYIDFTTSSVPLYWEEGEIKASRALKICLEEGVPEDRITFTSDGQGSLPMFNEKKECIGLNVGKVTTLYEEVRDAVLVDEVPFEKAIKTITSNPAHILKLHNKGNIATGKDADLVILDEQELKIQTVLAKGRMMLHEGEVKVFGTFER